MLSVERMSESDVMNGKQVFSFIISMVIKSAMKSTCSVYNFVCVSLHQFVLLR